MLYFYTLVKKDEKKAEKLKRNLMKKKKFRLHLKLHNFRSIAKNEVTGINIFVLIFQLLEKRTVKLVSKWLK